MIRLVALALTALTGFSGLVYEVAWQKYLATLLGSHSEATSAVLGIFLGGLSVGYWLFGLVTRRIVARAEQIGLPPRLLLVYGLLEGAIGVYVIVFPWLFQAIQQLSYAIPHGTAGIGFAIDVLLSALLIGPASVLMGGTIPMLTQALARSLDDATRFHAFVYAFNTAGAFAGALAAGFYLIPVLGLRDVMYAMGVVNLAAGAIFVASGLRGRAVVSLEQASPDGRDVRIEGFGIYASVALLTGFAMMAMQTTFIRLGLLAIGSAQFTFSMVVAVFVLAIALGSFLVSAFPRIPSIVVVSNQWGIALFFLLLYPRLAESPYWVLVLRSLFRDTNSAFVGYHFLLFLLMLGVIGLPVILSGAALPLLFHHMRRQVGHLGDLAGTLYSWNTVGSLLGALLGGYLLLFWLDLHQVYRLAIGLLMVAATLLSVQVYRLKAVSYLVLVPLLGAVLLLPEWNPNVLYSGLFRQRELRGAYLEELRSLSSTHRPSTMLYHADGPTASVVVREHPIPSGVRTRSLQSNGKYDADTVGDYGTTGMLAALPAMMAKEARRAFVIGFGIGTTAGELGSFESIERVDVAEISREIVEAAPYFDFATENASTNPKIHVIASDATRALMRADGDYDVIVSGPAQIWVAGVEMLYSREFLEVGKAKLRPGGVYCQFIHRYEVDDATIALAIRTFASVYDHVSIWQDVSQALLMLGFLDASTAADHFRLAQQYERPDFSATLARSRIRSFHALLAHELVPLGVIHSAKLGGPVQSFYHPRLNDLAARAMFRGDHAGLPFTGYGEPARIGAANSLLRGYASRFSGRLPDDQRSQVIFESCLAFGDELCNTLAAEWLSEDPQSAALARTIEILEKNEKGIPRQRLEALARLFAKPTGARAATTTYEALEATDDFVEYYHHAAPFRADALLDIWASCREGRPTEESCRKFVDRRLLASPDTKRSFDEQVAECMTGAGIGHSCQAGYDQVRVLLERGPDELSRPRPSLGKRERRRQPG